MRFLLDLGIAIVPSSRADDHGRQQISLPYVNWGAFPFPRNLLKKELGSLDFLENTRA